MSKSPRILTTKLRAPSARAGLIRRPRLLRELDDASSKVILLVAPGGFGKTTLLANWFDTLADSRGWITLRPEINNLPSFLSHLAAALDLFAPDIQVEIETRTQSEEVRNLQLFSNEVLANIENSPTRWRLVLEDFHVIDDAVVLNFITRMIDVMPNDCRLVISSRSEPLLPNARLRLQGDLTLITTENLRASAAECRAVLSELGVDVTVRQSHTIAHCTAGWMAALHLVGRIAQTRPVDLVIDMLKTFDGEFELLADFLTEEVIEQETREMQDILMQISLLDRFTVDACFEVTGTPASGQYLDQARRNGLFISELDESRTWFTFHPIFKSYLRRELNLRADPDSIARLHAAACRWFMTQNLQDEALDHAVSAKDWPVASRMIEASSFKRIFSYRLTETLERLEAFPREYVFANPNLSSIAAYALVRQGRLADAAPFLEAAELGWQNAGNNNGLAVTEFIRGAIARIRDDGAKLIEHGYRFLALADPDYSGDEQLEPNRLEPRFLRLNGTWLDASPTMIPYHLIALGLLNVGRISEGERLAEEIARVHLAEGIDVRLHEVMTQLALARLSSGRLVDAESILSTVVNADAEFMPSTKALALRSLAEVMYAWNHRDVSERLLEDGIRSLSQNGIRFQDAPLQLQLAQVRWSRGDVDGAIEALDAAAKSATEIQNRKRLEEIDAFRARVALSTGDVDQAQHWLLRQRVPADMPDTPKPLLSSFAIARIHIANGDSEDAIALLEKLRNSARRSGASHDLIQILALLSVAYLDMFELEETVDVLREALDIGEPGGYVRVFIDEGAPMTRLLRIAHRRGVKVRYINRLLEASGETPEKMTKFTHTELIEPITARELEVLNLVALSLTNKEISDELYIAISTVKRHITNLYGKLGVSSRTEAVQKARKLHLLSGIVDTPGDLPDIASM